MNLLRNPKLLRARLIRMKILNIRTVFTVQDSVIQAVYNHHKFITRYLDFRGCVYKYHKTNIIFRASDD